MRSFRLYRRTPRPAPARLASEMPMAERAELRSAFDRDVHRHRRIPVILLCFLAAGIGCMALSRSSGGVMRTGLTVTAIVCGVAFGVLLLLSPRLTCPACRRGLETGLGTFCPECGKRALKPAGWFKSARCEACDRTMWYGKNRGYRIRACSHCGLWLSDKGV